MSDSDQEQVPKIPASGHDRGMFASTSLSAHLARGALGFGLLGAAIALLPAHGPAALLLVPPGLVALRGCPTCWIAGLVETISAGRVRRTCNEDGCALTPATALGRTGGGITGETAVEPGGTGSDGDPTAYRGRTKSTRSRAA